MSSPWAPPPPTSSAKASSQVQPKGQSAQSTTTTTGSRCSAGGSENAAPLTPTVTPQNVDVSGLHLEEGDTTTTVAIGQDTYTIGKKIS